MNAFKAEKLELNTRLPRSNSRHRLTSTVACYNLQRLVFVSRILSSKCSLNV